MNYLKTFAEEAVDQVKYNADLATAMIREARGEDYRDILDEFHAQGKLLHMVVKEEDRKEYDQPSNERCESPTRAQ